MTILETGFEVLALRELSHEKTISELKDDIKVRTKANQEAIGENKKALSELRMDMNETETAAMNEQEKTFWRKYVVQNFNDLSQKAQRHSEEINNIWPVINGHIMDIQTNHNSTARLKQTVGRFEKDIYVGLDHLKNKTVENEQIFNDIRPTLNQHGEDIKSLNASLTKALNETNMDLMETNQDTEESNLKLRNERDILLEEESDHADCPEKDGIYVCSKDCPRQVDMELRRLVSPNHPLEYGGNDQCSWVITVPHGYKVKLRFSAFRVCKNLLHLVFHFSIWF